MQNICFSSDEFLDEVKYQIKTKYKNQNNYAKAIGYSRKALNRILNSGEEISMNWVMTFCRNFDMKIEDYFSYKRS